MGGFLQFSNHFINLDNVSSISITKDEDFQSEIYIKVIKGDNLRLKCRESVQDIVETVRDSITYTDGYDCTIAFECPERSRIEC